jgi:acetoacetyl-CoA synthetase
MSATPTTPRLLWQPDPAAHTQTRIAHFMDWLPRERGLHFDDYQALWAWSVAHVEDFWVCIWAYFEVISHTPYTRVLEGQMPDCQWFTGATLNYAEHIFRMATDDRPALLYQREGEPLASMSWAELQTQVSACAAFLRHKGVKKGDRVVGYLPNIPLATVAWLAAASIGAVWSSASPDFGASSVLERFGQIEPVVLFAVNGYRYGGKVFDKADEVRALQAGIPSVHTTVLLDYAEGVPAVLPESVSWYDVLQTPADTLQFEAVAFGHPLWVLYSSGTTGQPKAIVHGHGGMLLEHLKFGAFHNDVHAGERFFWYTTTGWMMWNYLQSMLLSGATIVLYDGSPGYPDMGALWRLVQTTEVQHMGLSAAFVLACMKDTEGVPTSPFQRLRSISSTGSPLPPEGFAWIYERIKSDVWLASMSGGTDVCTAFVGGMPILPVFEGEIQCRALGCAMQSFDSQGVALLDEVGEMVVTQPMPCMPVGFWNDPDGSKYRSAYFEEYPNVWRHGDWLRITPRQTLVILGRSDATLNRQGIRIGTSEIYRSVEQVPAVRDSLIVNIEYPDGTSWMPLFVTLRLGHTLTDDLRQRINRQLRQDYSPRHVPDDIIVVSDIPYTISGKKLEIPVKKLLMGRPLEQSVNLGSVRNPAAFDDFVRAGRVG